MTEKKIKRNMILSIVFVSIIVIVIFCFIFITRMYYMLWAPFLFILLLLFALYCDFGKLKETRRENDNNNN